MMLGFHDNFISHYPRAASHMADSSSTREAGLVWPNLSEPLQPGRTYLPTSENFWVTETKELSDPLGWWLINVARGMHLFYSSTGVSWHLWPCVALQTAALKRVSLWRGCLPLTDGWGWPSRSRVSGAALQWFMFCFCSPLIRNSGNQSLLSVLDSSHCVGGPLLTVAGCSDVFPASLLDGVAI